jgi:hypothetical protein
VPLVCSFAAASNCAVAFLQSRPVSGGFLFSVIDFIGRAASIAAVLVGLFVYRLGHGPLKAERWVRFPYGLPTSFSINKIK